MPKMRHIKKFNEELTRNMPDKTRCIAKIERLKVMLNDLSSLMEQDSKDHDYSWINPISNEINQLSNYIKNAKESIISNSGGYGNKGNRVAN